MIFIRTLFLCFIILLPGLVSPQSSTSADQLPPVVLGAVYNLTGRQAVLDKPSYNGALLAANETNSAGGVLGRAVALEVVDGESVPDTFASRTSELIDAHPAVAALFGISDSDMDHAKSTGERKTFL